MSKPDFFIVGAPKCGTTWLYHYLAAHPQVFMSAQKEPHYFNSDSRFRWVHGLEQYESLFDDAPVGARAVGEASTMYLHSHVAAANILGYQPRARFVAMVRNPLEMAISWHRQALYDQQESEPDFARAWALQDVRAGGQHLPEKCREPGILQYRSICSLGEQLKRLMETAGRDRVHVVLHEDLRRDPAGVYRGVSDFLRLDFWQPQRFGVVNPARERKNRVLRRVMERTARFKHALGLTRSFGLLRHLDGWNTRSPNPKPLPPALRAELFNVFADDVRLLSGTIRRPLDHWLA